MFTYRLYIYIYRLHLHIYVACDSFLQLTSRFLSSSSSSKLIPSCRWISDTSARLRSMDSIWGAHRHDENIQEPNSTKVRGVYTAVQQNYKLQRTYVHACVRMCVCRCMCMWVHCIYFLHTYYYYCGACFEVVTYALSQFHISTRTTRQTKSCF